MLKYWLKANSKHFNALLYITTIALTRRTFVGKVMSLLFNVLSRLVITFLPRSKRLLISWLQSPSAVILEPKNIKSDTVSTVLKGTTEDEMAGWHHWLDGRESEWTPGDGDEQGGLACCDSWGRKELDTTERLNWTEYITTNWRFWILSVCSTMSRIGKNSAEIVDT